MYSTFRVLSSRAHHPLIKFLGKRTYPSDPNTPHPHPAAPVELKQKFEASESRPEKTDGKARFSEFWEAPERFWRKDISEAEITAILSGGASLH